MQNGKEETRNNQSMLTKALELMEVLSASPDGKSFNATFEYFKVKHLPDQRRLEWLEKNVE